MNTQARAYMYAASAVLCWSTVASAFKLTLRVTGVHELLMISTLTSFAVLLTASAIRGRLRDVRTWTRKEWVAAGFRGLLNPFLYYLVLFRAYDLLPAQEAQPLNYTWPIVLVLLSILLLRQRVRLRSLGAMLVSFSGVVVISTRGDLIGMDFTNIEGVALAVGSSFIWALYWILNMRGDGDPVLKLTGSFAFGSVYVTMLLLLSGSADAVSLSALLGSMYVGVFEMGLTFIFWMQALTLSSTTARISNLVYFSPFLSLLVIHHVVGEDISASTVSGLVLIVGGIVLQRLGERGAHVTIQPLPPDSGSDGR
ncbi:MAG: DMT family transporter [Bacteroidetes bacterium]|nr:DMT family transporter [Bacteroidota bacterium]